MSVSPISKLHQLNQQMAHVRQECSPSFEAVFDNAVADPRLSPNAIYHFVRDTVNAPLKIFFCAEGPPTKYTAHVWSHAFDSTELAQHFHSYATKRLDFLYIRLNAMIEADECDPPDVHYPERDILLPNNRITALPKQLVFVS